jgi:nucleolar complex protein 3
MGRGDVKKTKASIKVKNKETNKKLRKKFRGTGKSFEEKALQSAKAQPPNKKAIQNVSNRREEEEKRIKAAASYLMEEDEEYRDVFRRDEELEFEKGVRKPKSFAVDSEDKAAPLPIKSGDGRVVRVKHQSQVPDVEEEVVVSEDDKMDGDSVSEEQVQIPPEERIATFKSKVAEAAVSVLGNPEEYLPLVSGIEAGLKDDLEAIRSIAIASLGELFVDIIPGYRIKPPVEASNGASKLSKEVRKLWNFESSLLRKYKAFVEILKKELKKAKALKSSQNISLICKVSVKAACKLLVNAFHFNQALEVVEMLVPLINSKNGFFNEQCRESVVQVFRSDTAGDASLQIVSCIHSIVKSDPGFIHPFLLEVLLSLPLRHIEDDSYKAKDVIRFQIF